MQATSDQQMEFDPNNNVIQLCVQGMELEGEGKPEEAYSIFLQAWNDATNDFEKFTAAYYVARQQKTVPNKLKWLEASLQAALRINDVTIMGAFPALYSNIAKCYEDLAILTTQKRIMNQQIRSRAIRLTRGPCTTGRRQICRLAICSPQAPRLITTQNSP